jgi:hypothetical protein
MTEMTLTQTRIAAGVWEGVLTVAGEVPPLQALHQGKALDGVEVKPLPGKSGRHAVRVPIPAAILTEGVQTVLLQTGDTVLAQFSLIAGTPLDDDLRAEIGLLRAELDLLKRAFRRHCAETQS